MGHLVRGLVSERDEIPKYLKSSLLMVNPRNTRGGKYHCTIDLLFDWFGISCMTTDNFCFYLQNRLIQTSQTGAQWYSDTSLFSIPWLTNVWAKLCIQFSLSGRFQSGRRQVFIFATFVNIGLNWKRNIFAGK